MRTVGWIALATVTLVAPAWSQEVYRWQDGSGQVHYSNTPSSGHETAPVADDPLRFHATPDEPTEPTDAAAASAPAPDTDVAALPDDEAGQEGALAPTAPKRVPEEEAPAVSMDASIRRNALERDLRATKKRLSEIEGQLRTLASQRTRFAQGDITMGDVHTSAFEVRSEEEKSLEAERDELAQHLVEIRTEGVKLRDETSTKLGGVPDWWVDPR